MPPKVTPEAGAATSPRRWPAARRTRQDRADRAVGPGARDRLGRVAAVPPMRADRSKALTRERLSDPDRCAGSGRHLSPGTIDHAGAGRGRAPAAERALATRYRDAAAARLDRRQLPTAPRRSRRVRHRAAWEAMLGSVRNLGRAGLVRHGDLGRRRGAVGPEGPAPRHAARSTCLASTPTRCRSTAAAASPAMTHGSCASSSAAGSQQGIRWVKMKIGREPHDDLGARPSRPRGDRRGASCSSTPTAPTRAKRRWIRRALRRHSA